MRLLRFPYLICICFAACGVDQSGGNLGATCAGPDCLDGGAVPAAGDDDTTIPPEATNDHGNADAAAPPSPQTPDGGDTEASHPVCSGQCLPDKADQCADWDPLLDPERSLYEVSESQLRLMRDILSIGPTNDAGAPLEEEPSRLTSSVDASVDVGVSPEALEPEKPDAGAFMGSCQVGAVDGLAEVGCWYAGSSGENEACTSTRDCAPGLGCVGSGAGKCLPFCCGGDEACNTGDAGGARFCDERPLRAGEMDTQPPLMVPVCVTAELCDLAEPFPCPDGGVCTCDEGKACTIVNQEGSTGCRTPGEGLVDEPCPCAAGYFCQPSENTCKKLCNVERQDGSCGDNVCQAAPGFRQGWGLCQPVAPADDGL